MEEIAKQTELGSSALYTINFHGGVVPLDSSMCFLAFVLQKTFVWINGRNGLNCYFVPCQLSCLG